MPIQKVIRRLSLPPTGTKENIPLVFHEPHVETGFRPIHQPWYYYLLSLFQRHNECMNAWTHLVGCVIAMARIYKISYEFDAYNDPWMYPMLAGSITMIIMYFCSFAAHTFHNMSELLHHTCFFIDYSGIGLYGLGSTIIHYFYCTHPALVDTWIYKIAVPVAVVLSVMVCLFCSHSKTKYKRPYPFTRKIWQLSSVLGIYSWLIIPIVHRMYLYYIRQERPAEGMVRWDQSLEDHTFQMIWFLTAGFFFGSDIPQRFFPGKFDFLFHSHQIFHVLIMFMNFKQIDGMYTDIHEHLESIKTFEAEPTIWNTFGAVFLGIAANSVVIYIFHNKVADRLKKESVNKKTDENGTSGHTFLCD